MTKIKNLGFYLLGLLVGLCTATVSHADSPQCESLIVDQPSPMNTALDVVYTWDTSCSASPQTVTALRDDTEIDGILDKTRDQDTIRYEGTLTATTSGMHHIGVAVTLDSGESYDLFDSVLVSGTSAHGAESSQDDNSRADGCSAAPTGSPQTRLLGFLTLLLADFPG